MQKHRVNGNRLMDWAFGLKSQCICTTRTTRQLLIQCNTDSLAYMDTFRKAQKEYRSK